ncbi:MAG: hypothetical protein HY332_09435 [Chloroflexi bacterium]|nr:hypothetical protein [Chloroflexota bacterium]
MSVRQRCVALALVVLVSALTGCERDGVFSGKLVRYGEHTIPAGQEVDGDLVVVGGHVRVEQGARVTGSVYVVGGDAALDGEVGEGITLLR